MHFDIKTVNGIARLAQLDIPEEKQEKFICEMEDILKWVEQLQQVNVEGVEPLYSVAEEKNVQRPDEVTTGDLQDELMQNAPDTVHGFYVVPKVVE